MGLFSAIDELIANRKDEPPKPGDGYIHLGPVQPLPTDEPLAPSRPSAPVTPQPKPLPTVSPPSSASQPRRVSMSDQDLDTLVRTMMGECRGEPLAGQIAVAHVIFNRVTKHSGQFLKDVDVKTACQRAWQFSCWNANDPNRTLLVTTPRSDAVYARLQVVAQEALFIYNMGVDLAAQATHYYAPAACAAPAWSAGHNPSVVISSHRFYAGIA